jgi:hypothetical protein
LNAAPLTVLQNLFLAWVVHAFFCTGELLMLSLHSISVQNKLLKHEKKGLREALAKEKRSTRNAASLLIFSSAMSITVELWSGHPGRLEKHVLVRV